MWSIQHLFSFLLITFLLTNSFVQAQETQNTCNSETCEMAANVAKLRTILKVIKPFRTADGDGVALFRSIGGPKVDYFDPYLLLDEFKSENVRHF
jgi:hypothetical protein